LFTKKIRVKDKFKVSAKFSNSVQSFQIQCKVQAFPPIVIIKKVIKEENTNRVSVFVKIAGKEINTRSLARLSHYPIPEN
jgi:hypothetical protein